MKSFLSALGLGAANRFALGVCVCECYTIEYRASDKTTKLIAFGVLFFIFLVIALIE